MKVLFVILLTLVMGGCTTSAKRPGSPECKVGTSGRALAEGTAIGALGGAALGAGTGQLAAKNAGMGAGIGAAVGALAGLAYAMNVESSHSNAVCQEAQLDQAIASLHDTNLKADAYNNQLSSYVTTLQAQIDEAYASKKNRKHKLNELAAEKTRLEEWKVSSQNQANKLGKAIADAKAIQVPADSPRKAQISAELARLEQVQTQLLERNQALAAAGSRF